MKQQPEELYNRFAEALNSGNLEAIVALFEEDAILIPQPGQEGVQGLAAIREAMQGFLALQPKIVLELKSSTRIGQIALLRSIWRLTGIGPDGQPLELSGSGAEVVRRQPDGNWLYLVDHPWSVEP